MSGPRGGGRGANIEKEHYDNLMDGMVIAKLDSHGHNFEIILEADYVNDGKPDYADILEHMPSEAIFSDGRMFIF